MKVRYIATFAALSLLGIGSIAFSGSSSLANPCAGKVNPCAGKKNSSASVGAPLAKELQGKPVVIDVYRILVNKLFDI